MVEAVECVTPAAMEGQGFYNRSSRIQAGGIASAVPMMERAARAVPLSGQAINIADYGSSQGRNSLVPLSAAIDIFRQRVGKDPVISVVHTDLPENDFTALFQTVNRDPSSYLHHDPAVFSFAVGRSFYEQILPSDSVTLGWSSWAAHWLSRCPGQIPDQVQAIFSHDAEARAVFAKQSAEDWERFLSMRERELRPGGRLIVLAMASDYRGELGQRALVNAIYEALLDLVKSGFLSAEELSRMVIPSMPRTREEFIAPFAGGRFGTLQVEEVEIYLGEDLFWAEFEKNGDAQAYGAQWAAFSRASAFPSLAKYLEAGKDPMEFYQRLEAGMAARVAANPEQVLIPLCRMVMSKAG
jgi:hypothetical protein